jgi:DnaJ-class molecular chaperone
MAEQLTLPWPGTDEPCPKCQGEGDVYYLHASRTGVDVVGGKRVVCPLCAGTGRVRAPAQDQTAREQQTMP